MHLWISYPEFGLATYLSIYLGWACIHAISRGQPVVMPAFQLVRYERMRKLVMPPSVRLSFRTCMDHSGSSVSSMQHLLKWNEKWPLDSTVCKLPPHFDLASVQINLLLLLLLLLLRDWKVSELESVRIHFYAKLKSVRIRKCQNLKVSESVCVRIVICQNCGKLESVRIHQVWKVSETAQIGKCQKLFRLESV